MQIMTFCSFQVCINAGEILYAKFSDENDLQKVPQIIFYTSRLYEWALNERTIRQVKLTLLFYFTLFLIAEIAGNYTESSISE